MNPEFTADKTSGCAGLVVNFKDQTTGNPKFWNWDFGNGTLANVQNPTVVYSTPGTYTVTLVVRNADGTTGITKTNFITVTPAPTAAFTSNITTGCLPITIQFTDLSNPAGGSIASWQWDFGDGTTSTDQNPQKSYDKTGFYNVSLTITSPSGCKSTSSRARYIRIVAGVKAEFNFDKSGACQPPFPTNFTNLTSGPGSMSYQWDLGNGATSTAINPSTTYNAAGNYTVTLTATSEFGCSNAITKTIELNGPTTGIDVPDSVCKDQEVLFKNNGSITPTKVAWDFGNGEVSSHVNESTTYTTAGNYVVKVVNTYPGCIDSATKNIYVRPSPSIDFTVTDALACKAPATITVTDASSSPIVDWKWDFGDGGTGTGQTTTHTYNNPNNYNISVSFTDNKGCVGKLTKPAVVQIIKPTVGINGVPAGGCVPFTFTPTANVSAVDGVQSYKWDFGDGTTSTDAAPTHIYNNTGRYTISLTITTNTGCTETVTVPDGALAGTPPVVDFNMAGTDVCASQFVQFTDLTTPSATLNKWEWDFGDHSVSDQQNPLHKFKDTGNIVVKLTAYNNGCPATSAGKTIHVRPPKASFSYKVACGSFQVDFTNASIVDPTLSPFTYKWEFGNPVFSTLNTKDPSVTFPGPGKYPVKMTVTNGSCYDILIDTVYLIQETPNFTMPKTGCRNTPITLTSTNTPALIDSFYWSVDGGPYSRSDKDTVITFTTFGTHNISMRIVDLNGCAYVKNDAINITGPTAAFTSNSPGGCTNDSVTFTDNTVPAGSITKWTFDFGDGQTQSFAAPPFKHAYKDTGAYKVKLTVQDNAGCIDTISLKDTLFIGKLRPWFYAEHDTICPKSPLQFIDSSITKNLTYLWQFGDGNTSTLQNPTHIYGGSEATYTVKLTISDRGGCTDSVTRNRFITTVSPKPAFDYSDTTTICPPIETKFTSKGTNYESLYWDFGDGFTSLLVNPTHFYNDYGDFEAKLYLVGYGGCLDSTSRMVHVYNPSTTTTMSYSPLDACNELTVDFSITTPPGFPFVFFPGDGTLDTSQATQFQHFYSSPAFYSPSINLYDPQGCQIPVGGPNQIKIIGAEPFFAMDRKKFCDSGVVYFTNYTIGNDPVVTRTWNFGDGSPTVSDEDPVHYYEDPGLFLTKQTVVTQQGCTKTVTDTVRVYRTPDPIIGGDSIACINEPFNFKGLLAVPDTAITWQWDMGASTHLNTQDISLTFANKGNYKLYLKATNLLGCTDSTSKNIFVPPIPDIAIESNNITIPVSTGVTLPVTYGPDIDTYTWTPAKDLSCTDCPTPYANPKFTTTYNVKVADIYGCTNSQDLTVTVVCNGLNYWLPNTFSPNGDGVNDVFAPRGVGLTRINSMRIFNRWGQLVWEKMNFVANDRTPNGGWDGTFKGKPASSDVYVYIIEFVCENAAIIPVKGNVALIR